MPFVATLFVTATLVASPPVAPADSLPLVAPDSLVTRLIHANGFAWHSRRVGRFLVYYEPGTSVAGQVDGIARRAEAAITNADSILGGPPFDRGLRLFLVDSRDRMRDLIGQRYKGEALIGDDAVLLVCNDHVRPYLRHELFHTVSIDRWGRPAPWLVEGSAVYADGTCLDYEEALHTISAYLLRHDMLFPLDDLIAHFRAKAAQDDLVAYLEAGSFFQFLLQTYGRDPMERLWRASVPGNDARGITTDANFKEIYGKDRADLETEWKKLLSSQPAARVNSVDLKELREKGCG